MSSDSAATPDKADRIRELLATEGDAVAENTRGFNAGRYDSTGRLEDYETLKSDARKIKEDAIARLPELIDSVTEAIEANGGTVYLADDAADANEYITELTAEACAADRLVKSKSMTSEEIEVNDALEAAGVEVVETDLGEWVLQLADEAPSHIVAPAIHKSREAIAELFAEQFDPDEPPETAEELTMFARERLGELVEDADVGMTGANFIAADSGTMLLVTSEGNARKTVTATDTHIAVAGVEKLVPTVEDFSPFVDLIGRSGTGQDVTSYISMLTPPVGSPVPDFEDDHEPLADAEDDREFHLVLIDNGRMAMRDDAQLKETLYCIRCSACSNACGNFQSVGGHAFGGETYSGGIATGWEAGIEGLDVAAEFNDLCTGCSRCVPACPVGIDIPWINTVVRDRLNRGDADRSQLDWAFEELVPDQEPAGLDLGTRLVGNYETLAKWGSRTAPVANRLASFGPVRALAERVAGIDRRRDLPAFASESLVDWFERRGGPAVPADEATREAVVYPDTATNYADVDRGKAAIRALEAFDVHVRVPETPGSGRPPLSQGMIETANTAAHDVYTSLVTHIDAGRDVVVIEPSDLAMFQSEYEKFLPTDSYERLADASYDIMEYLFGLLENGGDPAVLRAPTDDGAMTSGKRIAYHPHCQARTIGISDYATAVMERLGYDVRTSETECCGMAGSFGYKTDYYELSMDVGEPLQAQFGDTDRTVVAAGTSCTEQLDGLLGSAPIHPVELVAPQ